MKIPSFIATLGTGGILTSLALLVSATPVNVASSTYPVLDLVNGSFLKIGNVLSIAFLVFIGFYITLRFTAIGRKIFYVGSNIKMSWMFQQSILGLMIIISVFLTFERGKTQMIK